MSNGRNDSAYALHQFSIVAVHGINGDAHRTWTSTSTQVCWLNDANLLPNYIRDARVLTWGYNASVVSVKARSTSADRILQHAQTLIAQLQADREVCCLTLLLLALCAATGKIHE